MTVIKKILRNAYATSTEWSTWNGILKAGQKATESDTGKTKTGDGVTLYIPLPYDQGGGSETIIVKTDAEWQLDATIYPGTNILVTSDSFLSGTNVRAFKIADGTNIWADLDYIPDAVALAAQALINANAYTDAQISGISAVQSVTGDGVDNTDPENPVLTFPTPVEIGAATQAQLDNHITDSTDAHAGTAISFTPTGTIAATNVQAAIVEVNNEKQPLDSDLTNIAALTPGNLDFMEFIGTQWQNRTPAQVKTNLAINNVDNTSDVNKPVSTAQAAAIAAAVVGLLDDRGNYDASGNVFPSSGGSGTAGAILKGDLWLVSVAGTLGGIAVTAGDTVRALADTPGQTSSNWAVNETNIGYVPENSANKNATGGYAGLSAFSIILKNAAGTISSLLKSIATVARNYTFPDKDITVAGLDDIQTGAVIYAVASGTNTYAATFSPTFTTFTTGQRILVTFTSINTAASTLAPGGGSAIAIVKQKNVALVGGELNGTLLLVFNGTNLEIANSQPNYAYITILQNTTLYSPIDSATDYGGPYGNSIGTAATGRSGGLPAGFIVEYQVDAVWGTAGGPETANIILRVDNTTDNTIKAAYSFAGTASIGVTEKIPITPLAVNAASRYAVKIINPAYTTNPASILIKIIAKIRIA